MEDLAGKILENRYRILQRLDGGSMATVYRAFDVMDSQEVAIKVLREDLAIEPEFIRRFRREAEKLKRLAHGDIVRIWEFKQKGNFAYISMEFIEGSTLQHVISDLQGHPMPSAEIIRILTPVCNALSKAHKAGIIHCDIKPANIMMRQGGRAVVSDFGIAREVEGTATMERFGTSAYMSPEQIQGADPTPQMDIYAVGVILYQLMTGQRPFSGQNAEVTGSSAERIRWEQINWEPPSPRKLNKHISADMENVILKCLAKDPRKRFKNTQDLLDAVASISIYTRDPKPAPMIEKISISDSIEKPQREKKRQNSGSSPKNRKRSPVFFWILGLVAIGSVILIALGGVRNNLTGSYAALFGLTSTQQATRTSAPTRQPTRTPNRTTTAAALHNGCISWRRVSDEHVGKYTCVYGQVTRNQSNFEGESSYLYFGSDYSSYSPDFRIVTYNYFYFPGIVENDCIEVHGVVQDYGPFLFINPTSVTNSAYVDFHSSCD